jgi:serine/threonine protein kinase
MLGLEHPNIVPFIDYVPMKEGIRPYIVMKLALRGSLKDEMKKRQATGEWMPIRRGVFLLDQASAGLEYIHGKGIVHRDVKPDNLLLASENELWLSDFGIAQQLIDDPSKSAHFAGTVTHSAPEQIRGKPEAASDQYALAITAYELFTGRRPFTGGSAYDVMSQCHEDPLFCGPSICSQRSPLNCRCSPG